MDNNRILIKNHDEEYMSLSNSSVGVKYKHSFVKMNEGSVKQTELMTSFRYKTQKHEKVRPEPSLDTLFPGQSPMFSLTAPLPQSSISQAQQIKIKKGSSSSPKKQVKGSSSSSFSSSSNTSIPTQSSIIAHKSPSKSFKNVIKYLSVMEPVKSNIVHLEPSMEMVTNSIPSQLLIPVQLSSSSSFSNQTNHQLNFVNHQPITQVSYDTTPSTADIDEINTNNNETYSLESQESYSDSATSLLITHVQSDTQQQKTTTSNIVNNCITTNQNGESPEDYSILKELLEYTFNNPIQNFNINTFDSLTPLESSSTTSSLHQTNQCYNTTENSYTFNTYQINQLQNYDDDNNNN
ncbi:hypothetical protein PPL_10645 [Heterostelium album PN500]|uniref:Uncharacterized protein n=1 Tax=Heterostelium pallidum (strain ATCC 26659 / Pp 5 / PN500) TaxID=670386 RepID=D3BRN4_HETP5|nr:hypothetical protein PPL_10645 [Heterostelium album PN500]EFA76066.1 hypothetical protein PPL_10645 [Heterostelium album PN500]|eukprot:XP_020428200.1 hypothetical protein PPL_10645 [Heterostelium album PN500]